MKKQHHYTTAEEILTDMQAAEDKAERLLREAEIADGIADGLFKTVANGDARLLPDAQLKREEARDKRASATRLRMTRLRRLSDTLAAFRTMTLPGIVEDPSVVLQDKRTV